MKNLLSTLSVAVLALAVSNTALAHIPPLPHSKHFAVAGATITGGGTGFINGNLCTVTITGTIGPDVGTAEPGHTGHADYATVTLVNSGAAVCSGKTLNVKLYPDGHFDITGQTGLDACFPSPPFPPQPYPNPGTPISGTAVLTQNGAGIDADIDPMAFGGCTLEGYLNAGPATIVTHP